MRGPGAPNEKIRGPPSAPLMKFVDPPLGTPNEIRGPLLAPLMKFVRKLFFFCFRSCIMSRFLSPRIEGELTSPEIRVV
jgi:hypothetical protein